MENQYNSRIPSTTALNSFYRSTGYGTDLRTQSLDTAIRIACSPRSIILSSLTTDINATPKVAQWTERAKTDPPVLLDGHHRVGVLRKKVLSVLEAELAMTKDYMVYAEKQNYPEALIELTEKKDQLMSCIARNCIWMALVYNKGKGFTVRIVSEANIVSKRA